MTSNNENNITYFDSYVSRKDREKLHNHKGVALWFTGLSASGKSTIAHNVEKILYKRGCSTYVFDGDNVRHGLCSDLTFSPQDRTENIRRIGEMVNLFVNAGIIAISAFISPYEKDREAVKKIIGKENFVEIFVDCPIEECIKRDPKGIYAKALVGEIEHFTEISAPYESPENPDIVIKADQEEFVGVVKRVVDFIQERVIIR